MDNKLFLFKFLSVRRRLVGLLAFVPGGFQLL
jgi:hypothetical protein